MPVRGGEGQGAGGEADVAVGGSDARGDRHVVGGGGVQRHGVGLRAVFGHGEPGRIEDDARAGCRCDVQSEAAVDLTRDGAIVGRLRHPAEAGFAEDDGRRRVHARAELVAGAPALQDDDGAGVTAGDHPVHLDVQRGGLPHPRPAPTVSPLLQINGQHERAAPAAVQEKTARAIIPEGAVHPVKQSGRQLHQLRIVIQLHLVQRIQPAEEARGEHGQHWIPVQNHDLQRVQSTEEARGQTGEIRHAVYHQTSQRPQAVEEIRGQRRDRSLILEKEHLQRAQPVEETRGERGQTVPGQRKLLQRTQAIEGIRGQRGQRVIRQIQSLQPAQPVEVSAPEDAVQCPHQAAVVEDQLGDPAQLGRGDVLAVGHAVDCRHDGCADFRGPATDVGPQDGEGEDEVGGVGIAVGSGPGVGPHWRKSNRRTDQGARGGVNGQADGKGTGQAVDQRAIAAAGFRQRQRRDGGAGEVDHVPHRGRTEIGDAPRVDDGDGHLRGGHDGAIAADGMGDGVGVVCDVHISGGANGDGPGGVPVGGAEGQGTGDSDVAGGVADGRRDGDVAGRLGGQDDGIGDRIVLIHGEGGWGNGDAGDGIDHRHGEGQDGRIFGRAVGVFVHGRPGQRDSRHHGGGNASQCAGAGGVAQAGREIAAAQSVDQVAVASRGFRQRQRRNGGEGGVGLRGDGAHAEIRPLVAVVGHRDGEGGSGDAVVAAHHIRDGGVVVAHVPVRGGGDGDGLGLVPVRGGEGQVTGGEAEVVVGGSNARGDRHVAGGDGVQGHEVGRRAVFGHGESGRAEDDVGTGGRCGGQSEAPVIAARVGGVRVTDPGRETVSGVAERDVCRRARRAERLAGASARRDHGGATGCAGDGPGDLDGNRGGLPHVCPCPPIDLPLEIDHEGERAVRVTIQV